MSSNIKKHVCSFVYPSNSFEYLENNKLPPKMINYQFKSQMCMENYHKKKLQQMYSLLIV